jgi:hypothetical protein
MDRAARVRAELERVKIEARTIEAAGPPCMDCKYKTLLGNCSNPAYYQQEFEPSTGSYSVKHETRIEEARSEGGLCGPEALLWEPLSKLRAIRREAVGYLERHPIQMLTGLFGLWVAVDLLF